MSWPLGRSGSVASPARSASCPLALGYRAAVHLHAGEFAAASALIEEAGAITEATGNAPVKYSSLLLAAWRGVEVEALDHMNWGLESVIARGEGRGIGGYGYTTAVLYNGLGRYEAALASARSACEYDDLGIFGFPSSSWSRRVPEAALTRRPLPPCDDSRNEQARSAQTGRSASRHGQAPC